MLLFNGPRQHNDVLCAPAWHECKALPCGAHVGQRANCGAQASHFHSQSRAMRFIRELQSECASDERVARNISRPCLTQRAYQREQHGTSGERNNLDVVPHNVATRIHDECPGRKQRFDFFE